MGQGESKLLASWRNMLGQTRKIRLEQGEWYLFEDDGERLIWCPREDRQAFVDAGIPERCLVHPRHG